MTSRAHLTTELTRLLLPLGRSWRQAADAAVADLGLSQATARPVFHISRLGDGVRQNVLARSLGIEGSSLVRLLDQLSAAGLVERRDDLQDRRAKTLHLTARGRKLVSRASVALDGLRKELFADVGAGELEGALRTLRKLEATLAQRSAVDEDAP